METTHYRPLMFILAIVIILTSPNTHSVLGQVYNQSGQQFQFGSILGETWKSSGEHWQWDVNGDYLGITTTGSPDREIAGYVFKITTNYYFVYLNFQVWWISNETDTGGIMHGLYSEFPTGTGDIPLTGMGGNVTDCGFREEEFCHAYYGYNNMVKDQDYYLFIGLEDPLTGTGKTVFVRFNNFNLEGAEFEQINPSNSISDGPTIGVNPGGIGISTKTDETTAEKATPKKDNSGAIIGFFILIATVSAIPIYQRYKRFPNRRKISSREPLASQRPNQYKKIISEVRCRSCSTDNPNGSKFCMECGSSLI